MADVKTLEQRLRLLEQVANAEIRVGELMGETTDKVAAQAKLQNQVKSTILAELDALNKIGAQIEANAQKQAELQAQIDVAQEGSDKIRLENQKKYLKARADELKAEKALAPEKKRNLELQLKITNATEQTLNAGKEVADNLLASVGITDSWKNTTSGVVVQAMRAGASFRGIAKALKQSVFSSQTMDNLIGSTMMKVQESTMAMIMTADSALAGFNKLMGAGGRLDTEIVGLATDARDMGISFGDSIAMFQELAVQIDMFTQMSKGQREQLVKTAESMHIFGVSAAVSGEMLQNMTRSLGMSTAEVDAASKSLIDMAVSVGEPPEQMIQQFNKLIPEFVRYGDRAESAFKAVARQAKALGVEIEDLIGVSQKFDTFEDAGTTAGKLMGILGQPVDVMGLMRMDPEERITEVLRMIENSGMQAEILNNKFGAMTIGGILGMSPDAATKAIRLGVTGYKKMLSQQRATAAEEEKQRKAQMTIMNHLQMVIQDFAVQNQDMIVGVINGFKSVLEFVGKITNFLGGEGIIAVIGFYKVMTSGLIQSIAKHKILAILEGKSQLRQSVRMKMLNAEIALLRAKAATEKATAGAAAAKGLMMMGAAVALVGAGIGLAAAGVALLASALKDMSPDQIQGLAIVMGVLALSIIGLALAMAKMAVAGLAFKFVVLGFAAMAVGIGLLAASLFLIKTEDLTALGNVFTGLGKIAENSASGIHEVAGAVREIASAMDDIDDDKVEKLQKVSNAVSRMMVRRQAAANAPAGGAGRSTRSSSRLGGGKGQHVTIQLSPSQQFELEAYIQRVAGTRNPVSK